MAVHVPLSLRRQIQADAGHRCGYCRSSQRISGVPLEIEHIIPDSLGGPTVRENLWLACHQCNKFKSNRQQFEDPETGVLISFFNPRTQNWREHFRWSPDGTHILGLTACGRATIEALQMNNEQIVESRQYWVIAGWHPPFD